MNKLLHNTDTIINIPQTCSDCNADNQILCRLPTSEIEHSSELLKNSSKETSSHHRLINLYSLKDSVRRHFGPCLDCNNRTLFLEEQLSLGLASTLLVTCIFYNFNLIKLVKHVEYLKRKCKGTVVSRKLRNELSLKQRQLTKMKSKHNDRRLQLSSKGAAVFEYETSQPKPMQCEINIQAMLVAYYMGTGGSTVGAFASFFGLSGGITWEMTKARFSKEIQPAIIESGKHFTQAVFIGDIEATVKEKYGEKYQKQS